MDQQHPPQRRPYQRYAAEVWQQHRDETRVDLGSPSPTSSTSSGLPSNIEFFTPKNDAESSRESATVTTPTSVPSTTRSHEPTLPPASAVLHAAELAMDAKYQESASHFRQLSRLTSSPWGSVLFDFNAAIMGVASNGGCPQTVAARVSNVLSQYLFQQRELHRANSLNEKEQWKVLSGLRMNAQFWGSVVVQQRALHIWEPVLGPDHPKIVLLHECLDSKRRGKVVNLDTDTRMVKSENSEFVSMDLDVRPSAVEDDLLYLSDYPLGKLLGELELTGRANEERFSHEIAMLRFGRSRALAGLHYSLADRFADAQIAFHDSAETLEHETCIEIKLHRILWDAEHKTRIHDWEGAWDSTCRSHKIFIDAQGPSQFFAGHFIDRFAVLMSAIRQRMSVDRTRGLGNVDRLREQGDDWQLLASGMESPGGLLQSPPLSAQEISNSDASRFPQEFLTSVGGSGIHEGIDIGAWLEVVHSSLTST